MTTCAQWGTSCAKSKAGFAFKVQDNSTIESNPQPFIMQNESPYQRTGRLANFIFASRWLQLPLYLGLILAQCVYVYHFWIELIHLMEAAFGSQAAVQALVGSIGYKSAAHLEGLNETLTMLVVLGLIDVVMISNLLIMVIVGGYETFVSRMYLENHPDQPEWLSHVNASVLKVKLSTAIIGISSIHLLKSFINAENYSDKVLLWQTLIHLTFLLSALAIAWTDRLMHPSPKPGNTPH